MSDKTIKMSRSKIDISEKQLTMSMNVDSSAEPCVQAVDFYQRSVLTETAAENFNNVPFNKGKKRIPLLTTGRVLRNWTCTFDGKDIDLSAKEVEVDKFAVMIDICISDIEDSFLVDQMKNGANNNVNPAEFLAYVWRHIGDQAGADIEDLRWDGDKQSNDPFYSLTNGYKVELEGAANIGAKIDAVGVLTPSNVIGELYRAIGKTNPVLRKSEGVNEMKIFISSDIALAFAMATSQNTAMGAYINNTGDMFLGRYKLIETPALGQRTIIISPKQDLVYTYDLLDDKDNFITIDRRQYAGDEVIRFRVNMYLGFDVFDAANIVYYRPAVITPSGITINEANQTAGSGAGGTFQFSSTVAPAGADQGATWTVTSGVEISVDPTGLLTWSANTADGTYTITATTADGNFSDTKTLIIS